MYMRDVLRGRLLAEFCWSSMNHHYLHLTAMPEAHAQYSSSNMPQGEALSGQVQLDRIPSLVDGQQMATSSVRAAEGSCV
jgi:hypothetical protein